MSEFDDCKPGENCTEEYCEPLWDMTKNGDECIIKQYELEALNIAGTPIRVFKLLGVREQGSLVDLTGLGDAIASSYLNEQTKPEYAFQDNDLYWASKETGQSIIGRSFLGYRFEGFELENLRTKYSLDNVRVKKLVTTVSIQLGDNEKNRSTKFRVERSDDGVNWKGVAIIQLENSGSIQTTSFRSTAPSIYWRFVPLNFLGGSTDSLIIKRISMNDKRETSLQYFTDDPVFKEMRSRDYASESITIKGYFDINETVTDVTRFLVDINTEETIIKMSFIDVIAKLGRPIIIGDILEIPALTQYDANNNPVPKYLEVTDVTWDAGFTPNWVPTMFKITAKPAYASEETQDIFGDLEVDEIFAKGEQPLYQDVQSISDEIDAVADNDVPMKGTDLTEQRSFTEEEIERGHQYGVHLERGMFPDTGSVGEDGLPPNGEPYTEGNTFPTSPKDGDYHRLTYEGLPVDIPPRLYRYSAKKGRWIYIETDRRTQYNSVKPSLDEYLSSLTKRSPTKKR